MSLVILQYKLKIAQLRNAKINLSNANEKNTILSDINKSQAEYSKLYSLYERLTLRSPFNGILYETAPDIRPGVFVTKNEWLADIVDPSNIYMEAYVNEHDLYLIKNGLTGYFYPEHLSQQKIPVKVISIDALNTRALNCEYSTTLKKNKNLSYVVDTPCYNVTDYGGQVPTFTTDEGKFVPVNSIYRIKLVTLKPVKIYYVERGNVVLHTQSYTYAGRIFYWIKNILLQQTGF